MNEKTTTILVYASLSPEYLIEKGSSAGLSEEAINMFRHFEEVPLTLSVDSEGLVRKCQVMPGFPE